jgi:glucokinase
LTTDDVALAIDIGGTKLAAALVDATGRVLRRSSLPTGQQARLALGGPADVLGAVEVLARSMAAAADRMPLGIGIASAGPVDITGGRVTPVNIPDLHGRPLVDHLRGVLPDVPVTLVGDGLAAAAGEHWAGAGRGHDNLVAVVVSTGVGGGLILDGRLHYGSSGNAGHTGHAPVAIDGDPCPCGARGCPEAYASGPALLAWARSHGWDAPDTATGADLAAAARTGDPIATRAFKRAGDALGTMSAAIAATCDVSAIVFGGGVAASGETLLDPIRRSFAAHAALGFVASCRIVPLALGGDICLIGAAALVHRPEQYTSDRFHGSRVLTTRA